MEPLVEVVRGDDSGPCHIHHDNALVAVDGLTGVDAGVGELRHSRGRRNEACGQDTIGDLSEEEAIQRTHEMIGRGLHGVR